MNAELDRLAELEAKATPGPWNHSVYGGGTQSIMSPLGLVFRSMMPSINAAHDVVFTTALRNAAPALLAAARERDELRAELAAVTAERDRLREELGNIVRADWRKWDDATADDFVAWSQSRARAALAQEPPV